MSLPARYLWSVETDVELAEDKAKALRINGAEDVTVTPQTVYVDGQVYQVHVVAGHLFEPVAI